MAVLVNSGRAAIALAISQQPIHLGWGSGDPAWDASPVPEPVDATGLVNEIGRRSAMQVSFVTPDDQGGIVVPTGRFALVPGPTNHLYLAFRFDFEDAPAATIREVGVFIGTTTDPALPAGQMYFEPQDLTETGTLLVLERTVPIIRTAATRETFEFVVSF